MWEHLHSVWTGGRHHGSADPFCLPCVKHGNRFNINAPHHHRGFKHIHRDNIECIGEANKQLNVIALASEISRFEQRRKVMPRENYYRIIKGYEPVEPAAFFEKLFYILWSLICAFRVIAIRIRLRTTNEK